MRIIAHRGLLEGPDESLQNDPSQVLKALNSGFEAEIDVWFEKGKWYLGHDTMDHEIPPAFLAYPGLWIHCKNIPAFYNLKRLANKINFFYHESDKIVLTSNGDAWTYFGLPETMDPQAICVMPEVTYSWEEINLMVKSGKWAGMCSDWPIKIRGMLS